MKKVVVILFLFCAKTVFAQSLYLGGDVGVTTYRFRQMAVWGGGNDVQAGICTHYIFNGNAFSYEGDLTYELAGPYINSYRNSIPMADFTAINYISFNPLYKFKRVRSEIKIGLFYTHYFTEYENPENDFGPAIAINLSFKISKKSYLGFELSQLYGLSNYFIKGIAFNEIPSMFYQGYEGYSNITYTNLSIKFIHKL